ncbi:hypothetical protein [Herbidospora sp. NBRC 101105]|uniref:hypothetical protein n=1 Tax=Herbidospora sp. NBRC 101105 TaxID=3032195 RepID=UPI002552BE21|nr:hypothetical protein [Herbidospora sp. NBRC 101105]
MSMTVARRPHRLLTMAPAVLALGALFVIPAAPAVQKGDDFLTPETTGVLNLEPGECFTDPEYSPAAGEEIVLYTTCDQHADNQSYGFVHADDGPYDRVALADFGWTSCKRGFVNYWPGAAGAELDYYPILPTAETWADGDRDIMCVVYDPRGELGGSMLPRAS